MPVCIVTACDRNGKPLASRTASRATIQEVIEDRTAVFYNLKAELGRDAQVYFNWYESGNTVTRPVKMTAPARALYQAALKRQQDTPEPARRLR
jgi:hypothetical protein